MMIVRSWRGRAAAEKQEEYPAHFRRMVLPELKRIAGFRGASLLREERGEGIEFLVLTRWDSMEAIRGFTSDDVERAVVEPAAVAALLDFEERVRHYEVIEEM